MGMSASQARLLCITSRLTDNELQSQLLTQAKLRLANKSKTISDEYMNALSKTSLKMAAYDSTGVQTLIAPTANYLFTFEELKNQYGLVDASGNFLASQVMIEAYESSPSLTDFLYNNGVTLIFENEVIADIENTVFDDNGPINQIFIFDDDGELTGINTSLSEDDFTLAKNTLIESVQNACGAKNITNESVSNYISELKAIHAIEFNEENLTNWYNIMMETKGKLATEKKDPRQKWFENLWYRMGGISATEKGEPKYKKLPSENLNNSEWLEYALTHGIVSLEQVKNTTKPSELYPGLETTDWVTVQYNACQDIQEVSDDTELARAEAKYTKDMNELQAKDKDFDVKIKNLETIHSTLQTEYDSIKQMISKNIDRSYKTFGNG